MAYEGEYLSCWCTDKWEELTDGAIHEDTCHHYDNCGGWTYDPPCGGCDYCILAQQLYYDEDRVLSRQLTLYSHQREAVKMNA